MDKKSMYKCCNSFCKKKYKILYLPLNVERNKFLCGKLVEGYFILESQLKDKIAFFLPEGVNRSVYLGSYMPSGYFIYDSNIPCSYDSNIPQNICEQLLCIINSVVSYATDSNDNYS